MSTPLRILSVRQPWAWAIVHGGKDVENRVRNLAGDYRGLVAIQAGLTRDKGASPFSGALLAAARESRGVPWAGHRGEIIGVVELVGVHDSRMDGCGTRRGTARLGELIPLCSEWADPWAHHLVLANPRPLSEPMPWKGALHLQRPTADEVAEILRRVR